MADDKVMLITGASSGIGAETARHAAKAGWRLVLGARSEDKLDSLAGELGGSERAIAKRCDVTDWEDVQGLVVAATEQMGRLDAVFANAGFGAKRGFLEESVEHWRAMIDTNVLGVALTIRAALPVMLDADAGHFVLTSSVAGKRIIPGSMYSATKWAVSAMAEALRQELRQMHDNSTIRVTSIAPGMVDTPFFEDQPQDALSAEDIANAVMYAVSEPGHVDINELVVRPSAQAG